MVEPGADARGRADLSAVVESGAAGSARASARYSWKLSRNCCVKPSGSGSNSRHEVGEMMMRWS
jgi:hypothetical protein